jgi:hypothetical protein
VAAVRRLKLAIGLLHRMIPVRVGALTLLAAA